MSDLTRVKITANYLRPPHRLRNLRGQMFGRAAPRRLQCTLASRSFFDGSLSSAARRDCRRTACNFALNKGLTRLRTAGRFVPFSRHDILLSLLYFVHPSRSRICSVVRNRITMFETCCSTSLNSSI